MILFKKTFRSLLVFFLPLIFSVSLYGQNILIPPDISIFQKAYPDVIFQISYSAQHQDWKITLHLPFETGTKKTVLFWAGGRFLPEHELKNKNDYWTVIYDYHYNKLPADPAAMTKEQKEALKKFSSDENRKTNAGTPMFFFNDIYDSYRKSTVEKHIKKITFLGFRLNIHERLVKPLSVVEKQLQREAKTDADVAKFIAEIKSVDGYNWREIAGTSRKSFHSLGACIDILPKNLRGKAIFWSWTKDLNPDGWMLTPLKDRWIPPEKVINIFEENGFIWGGKWGIWDNMHFEYHPEIILKEKSKTKQ